VCVRVHVSVPTQGYCGCTIVVLQTVSVLLKVARVCGIMTIGHLGAAGCFHNNYQSWLNIGCWNMHSLVEAEGSIATVSVRGGVQVDCKIIFFW